MIYLGIDPGLGGGLALLEASGLVLDTAKMPTQPAALVNLLLAWRTHDEIRAVLEAVHSSPQMGVVSAFTFGRGYGMIETALAATRIVFDQVQPIRWQSLLDCRSRGDKNITKARAAELFPELTITHWMADALLLAEYRRRMGQGIPFGEHRPTPAICLGSFLHDNKEE